MWWYYAAMAAMNAIGSASAAKGGIAQLEADSRAAALQTAQTYREVDDREREAAAQAGEQTSDLMREAQRRLSSARVAAAQGVGSYAAMAQNVASIRDENIGRINANLSKTISSMQAEKEAARLGKATADETARIQGRALRMSFLSQSAQGAANAYGSYQDYQSRRRLTENRTSDRSS